MSAESVHVDLRVALLASYLLESTCPTLFFSHQSRYFVFHGHNSSPFFFKLLPEPDGAKIGLLKSVQFFVKNFVQLFELTL